MSDPEVRSSQSPDDLEWSWDEAMPVRWWVHILLFFLACGTTLLAGIVFAEGDPFVLETWKDGALVMRGATQHAPSPCVPSCDGTRSGG